MTPPRRMTLLIALLTIAALVATSCDPADDKGGDSTAPGSEGSATTPDIEQVAWKVKTRLAPGHKKLTNKQKGRVKKGAAPIENVLAEVYDALFLAPEDRTEVVKARFLPPTAKALLRTDAGVTKGSSEVKMLRRSADIAIEVATKRLAVARVAIKAKGMNGDKTFTVTHKARWWFEKVKGRWKVIAFRIDQGPRR
ncbi:MAG: hypothetical protein GEU71_13295 [Actinobacteria bacterium]|nr:hypothetical protein [Actinomycetota bacterium]